MIQASKSTIIILIIGLVIAIFGLTVGILWSLIYSTIIQSQLALTPTSSNYELWKETPIPMYLKFYMFNLTNPEAFTSPDGTKPHFEEMGPYVFREIDYKVQQDWNENSTITYQRKRVWHFDESLSTGSLSDNVTNINPVTASIGYMLRFKGNFLRDIADRIMRTIGQKLVITKSVNELLFEGYSDTMLKVAQTLNLTRMPMTKFAWFFGRNDSASYDGTFNMHTGVSDMRQLGIVKEWNYNNHVSYYPGECGTVRGTNGDLWPPLPDNETVSFFVSDMCTSLTAKYSNTTEHEGLSGVTFTNNEATLDNGTKVASRKCYYEEESIPSGALNISSCKWGAPAFISFPHFYLGDPSYRANIIGMKPQKNKHELIISLEPKTGVPLNVNAKLQLNLLIDRDEKMKMFKNLNRTFVPMLWFTQEATLTADYAGTVKFIIILESLGSVTFFGIGFIGIIVMFVGIFVLVRNNFRGEENQVLLTRSMNGDSGIIDG